MACAVATVACAGPSLARNLIDEMKARIDTELGKQIYARRLGTLAPHAVQVLSSRFLPISVHKRMDRFTLRTKLKVDVQWARTRFALVHNIGKRGLKYERLDQPALALLLDARQKKKGWMA